VGLIYRRIILHKDAIVLEDRGKVFGQDLKVDFSCDAPPLRILVPLYNH
jgi:hypothetical protein